LIKTREFTLTVWETLKLIAWKKLTTPVPLNLSAQSRRNSKTTHSQS